MTDVQGLIDSLLKTYGWKTVEEMKASPQWAAAKTRAVEAARKSGGPPPSPSDVLLLLNTHVDEAAVVQGHYLGLATRTDYNDGKWTIRAKGPAVLFPDGTQYDFLNDQTLSVPPCTPVQAEPVRVATDLQKGTRRISPIKGKTSVSPITTPLELPEVGFDAAWRDGMQMPDDGSKGRIIMRGVNSNRLYFLTLTVGEPKGIFYSAAGSNDYTEEDTLKLPVRDAKGQKGSLKLVGQRLEQACDAYPEAGRDSNGFRDVLPGQRIAVYGRVGLFIPRTIDNWEEGQRKDAQQAIVDLHKNGYFVKVEKKGVKLSALSLRDKRVQEGGNLAQQEYVDVAGKKCYDIIETEPGSYQFSCAAWDEGSLPWVSASEKIDATWMLWRDRVAGQKRATVYDDVARQLGLGDTL